MFKSILLFIAVSAILVMWHGNMYIDFCSPFQEMLQMKFGIDWLRLSEEKMFEHCERQ